MSRRHGRRWGAAAAAAALALAGLLAGCRATDKKVNPLVGPPPEPPIKPYVVPAAANVVLSVSEAVADPADDLPAYIKIYVDGAPVGQTETAPKSKEKKWGDALPAGNHLFRFESWVQPLAGEWTPMLAERQPPERFIRVETGLRTLVSLKFTDGGRRHTLQIAREPLVGAP